MLFGLRNVRWLWLNEGFMGTFGLWLHSLVCVLAGFLLYLGFDVLLEEIRWRRRKHETGPTAEESTDRGVPGIPP